MNPLMPHPHFTFRLIRRVVALLSPISFANAALSADNKTIAFIEQHRTDCHDATDTKGGLDLTALNKECTNAETFPTLLLSTIHQ